MTDPDGHPYVVIPAKAGIQLHSERSKPDPDFRQGVRLYLRRRRRSPPLESVGSIVFCGGSFTTCARLG